MASVLITRPAGQAERLCSAIGAMGHTAHHLPLIELCPLTELMPPVRQHVLDLDQYQHLIFISGNAVRYGMDWIQSFWPQLPVGLNWYAVGESTAARLAEFGVQAEMPGANMSSEGLLALPGLQDVRDRRVLIVKGLGGRQTLAQALQARGAAVDELPCYRRSAPEMAPGLLAQRMSQWQIDLVLISSGEGFSNMLALLSPTETTKFRNITLLVPSTRVADLAHNAGFERVITAENASDAAMLRALAALQTSTGE